MTTMVDASLTNGTLYIYRVRALTGNGASDLSERAMATPTAPAEPPPAAAPQNLSATPGNLQIQLSWNAVTGATGYRVFRTTNGGAFGTTPIASVATPAYHNTGLTNGTAYSYRVAAYNAGGDGPLLGRRHRNAGSRSSRADKYQRGGRQRDGHARVDGGDAATSYNVYRGTAAGGQSATALATGVATPAFVDSPVTNGVTYFYKVTAVNAMRRGRAVFGGQRKPGRASAAATRRRSRA